jgi:hypothetical protein
MILARRAVLCAWAFWIKNLALPMHHMLCHHSIELREHLLVCQLRRDDHVILLRACDLVLPLHNQQPMRMRQTPLLELNNIYVGMYLAKNVIV